MEFLNSLNHNKAAVAIVLIVFILLTDFTRYRRRLYYNPEDKSEKAMKGILNRKYELYKVKNLDVEAINREMLIYSLISLVIGAPIMIIFNALMGLIVYLVLSFLISIYAFNKIGKSYLKVKKKR